MQFLLSKKIIAALAAIIIIIIGVVFWLNQPKEIEPILEPEPAVTEPARKVIGQSVEGREIESFTYGAGDTHLAFVGGMHGGYEWNSISLAYRVIDYLDANPNALPNNLTVTVIPNANPDGLFKIIGQTGRFDPNITPSVEATVPGRFNANGVDLNRNFDCKWIPQSTWRNTPVSAGTVAFSEPEAQAIRDFALANKPEAVIFWHSQASAVYASECEAGILPVTLDIMNAYASASGYTPHTTFDSYEINGDAEGWLASVGIPAITVELATHETVEFERNLAGIKALFTYFAK